MWHEDNLMVGGVGSVAESGRFILPNVLVKFRVSPCQLGHLIISFNIAISSQLIINHFLRQTCRGGNR